MAKGWECNMEGTTAGPTHRYAQNQVYVHLFSALPGVEEAQANVFQ